MSDVDDKTVGEDLREAVLFAGGGRAGALMRQVDWMRTPFGSPRTWPQSLRSAVSICLGTNFPIALYWGPQLSLLYNDAWSDIPGKKHPWALGRPGRDVWPEIWDAIGPLFERVQKTGEGVWQEDQLLPMHRHGYTEECYFNFTFSPIRGENGTVEGIFNAVVETTYRVIEERRERTLRELAEQIALARLEDEVIATAADILARRPEDVPFCLFYRFDENGAQAFLVARAGLGIDAYAPASLRADDPGAVWPIAGLTAGGGAVVVESLSDLFREKPESRAWPETVERALVAPVGVQGGSGVPIGFLVSGISPRRELDGDYISFIERAAAHVGTALANVRAYDEERRRAEALAEIDRAKTAFFSNVSHEFRTPLTLMLGPIEEALADRSNLIPRERERIEVIHRNGLRLLKLVNSLLDFSRIEAGRAQAHVEPTDLSALTRDLASNFRSAMEKAGLTYVVDCRPLSRLVPVDRDMWEKIVLNLLSNAFKFTFEGEIALHLEEMDGSAVLTVRDTGTGIASHELPKLFERFHRIEGARGRSIEGTGIGLALVQELVRFHDGQVRVDSREGQGTVFTVAIPLDGAEGRDGHGGQAPRVAQTAVRADSYVQEALRWLPDAASSVADAAPQPYRAAAGAPPPAPPARILLADDNADMRAYMQRLLSDDYRVEAVGDGLAALEAIRRDPPDLVLTDIMMPRLDGFGLIAAIRGDVSLRDLPVIALSARAGEEARVEGLDAGADDYLVKPFSARELLATVQSSLALARLRRDTTAALRESEARFRNMADQAPMMMWVTDAAANCTYLNRGWYEFTGQREDEGLGAGWLDVTHPDDRESTERIFADANERQVPFRIEYRLRRADGEYRWSLDVGAPRFSDDGAFLGFVGSVIDITDRKRAEVLQAAQARLLEAAMQDVPLGKILEDFVLMVEGLSSRGAIASILLTDAERRRLRHGAAPNLPAQYNALIDGMEIGPDVGSCGAAAFRRAPVYVDDIATHPLWTNYRDLPLAHGLRACWSAPILSTQGEVLGTFALYYRHALPAPSTDRELLDFVAGSLALIIERRAAEEKLAALNAHLEERVAEEIERRSAAEQALRHAQKMEAIGQLTGGVAHDFNNLLQVITGNLQLLTRDVSGNDRALRRVTNALAGVERGAKLASQLLAFGRKQPLEPKIVNIGRFVGELEDMLRRTLGEGIEIETRAGADLWNVAVDPVQVENAILNLAINARDAMDGNGRLTIAVANTVLGDGDVPPGREIAAGQYVMLAVTDTGEGMAPEIIGQVFEPFFSTKPVGKGTGLGLSMVYGFVKQSAGHIEIDSALHRGTTIRLYFPRVRREEDHVAVPDTGPIVGGSETILVAEDDEQVRETVVEMLAELGYRVLKAKDAATALGIIESGVHIDLLFTDVIMPGALKSVDVARKAQSVLPHIGVLFTSGYTENSIVHGGRLDPGVELLSKPYTRETLARKLRHVINNRGQRLAPAASRAADELPSGDAQRLRVLVVEDDALIRVSTVDMVEELRHQVREAGSAMEALSILEAEPVDILLTDIGLPGMSGEALARRVRATWPHVAIIFATGQSHAPDLPDPATVALLQKPFGTTEVRRAIARLHPVP